MGGDFTFRLDIRVSGVLSGPIHVHELLLGLIDVELENRLYVSLHKGFAIKCTLFLHDGS
jgi:hypothetical protein